MKNLLSAKNFTNPVYIECFLYINNRIEYNKLSNCMQLLVIFKLTNKIPMNGPY